MTKIIYPANAQDWTASAQYDGLFLELGGGPIFDQVGAVVVQFVPDVDFVGAFAVVGRPRDQSTSPSVAQAPFVPVPYIAVNTNGAAAERTLGSAPITQQGIIEVPANGLSVGLLVACTAGTCKLYMARLAGTVTTTTVVTAE